jgi:hypothetical protein
MVASGIGAGELMTEAERARLLDLCYKILNAEHNKDPNVMIVLVQQLNELLDERDRGLKGNPPAST